MSSEIDAGSLSTVENATRSFVNRIIAAGGSREGAEEIASELDPFHDCSLPCARGWPDGEGVLSCNQTVKMQMTISKPSVITTSGWDVHIFNVPWFGNTATNASTVINSAAAGFTYRNSPIVASGNGTSSGVGISGGLSIVCVPAGTDLALYSTGVVGFFNMQPDPIFLSGEYRLDATAFEVRSVGPELYRSGTVNCWQSPVPEFVDKVFATFVHFNANGVEDVSSYCESLIMPGFPLSSDDAVIKPDSVTFKATEGCYVVNRRNTLDPPKVDAGGVSPVLVNSRGPMVATPLPEMNMQPVWASVNYKFGFTPTGGSTAFTFYSPFTCKIGSFNAAGAQFLSLSDTDALTVTVKWRITRYPANTQPDLLVLAKNHPPLDDVAIKVYSNAVETLPIGVPVRMNNIGEFFKQVASTVTDVVGPALSLVPHPYVKAAGTVLTGIGNATRAFSGKKQEKKIEKKVERKLENRMLSTVNKAVKSKNKAKKK